MGRLKTGLKGFCATPNHLFSDHVSLWAIGDWVDNNMLKHANNVLLEDFLVMTPLIKITNFEIEMNLEKMIKTIFSV
jgi:hypothetical protein